MNAKAFHISVQGASHIKKGKECQDASASYYDEKYAVAIVCDGHGGDDYVRSAIGADLACSAAESSIKDFIYKVDRAAFEKSEKQREEFLGRLESSIINTWNKTVRLHYATNPFTEAEISILSDRAKRRYLQDQEIESAYGTTLLATVLTPDFWFGIHIGDGKCVAVDRDGNFTQPIPWDDRCFLNATTSICDRDAIGHFRHFYSADQPAAVFVGSDGIDDCFCNDEQLNSLYKTILYSFTASEFDAAVEDLKDYLPRLSAKGSGDDVSVAAILDLGKMQALDTLQNFMSRSEQCAEKDGVTAIQVDDTISAIKAGQNILTPFADVKRPRPSNDTSATVFAEDDISHTKEAIDGEQRE